MVVGRVLHPGRVWARFTIFFLIFIPQVVDSRSFRTDSVIGEFRVRLPSLLSPPLFSATLTHGVNAGISFLFCCTDGRRDRLLRAK